MDKKISAPKTEMVVLSRDEWIAQLEAKFGKDPKQWKFKCVQCGGVQCGQDFIDAGVKDPENYVYFSCIGRFVKDRGCDWTLGGLFRIHKMEVEFEGKKIPVFEPAD